MQMVSWVRLYTSQWSVGLRVVRGGTLSEVSSRRWWWKRKERGRERRQQNVWEGRNSHGHQQVRRQQQQHGTGPSPWDPFCFRLCPSGTSRIRSNIFNFWVNRTSMLPVGGMARSERKGGPGACVPPALPHPGGTPEHHL